MKALIQRVKRAAVTIDGVLYSSIGNGLLVFVGVEKSDDKFNAEKLVDKILKLRIFEDSSQKMNLSVSDIQGEILVVSQFTLCGDCKKGTRPSFDNSAPIDTAKELYDYFVTCFKKNYMAVKTGKFQAMMDVELVNDGPVTFYIEK